MHVFALTTSLLLAGLLLVAWAYLIIAWHCVRRRLRHAGRMGEKLPGEQISAGFLPPCAPVSILKPLKGGDSDLLQNLITFCKQDYPQYEILLGVADIADPAVGIVRQLQELYPDHAIRLIVAPPLGMNPKSSILHALSREAKHEIFALSDSDIHVQPDYLRRLTAPLCDSKVGLVTCMYVAGDSRGNPAGMLDALHIDQTFLPLVAVGSFVPGVRFAFGASIALRRDDLERAGGYASIADQLADDYMLGLIVSRLGKQTTLADFTVAHSVADTSLKALWDRELRWARTIRVLEAKRYAALPVTFWIVWAPLLVIAAGGAAWALAALAASMLLRWATAFAAAGLIQSPRRRRELIWLPLRDLLDAAVWCAAWAGSRVTWRDVSYHLKPDGTLSPAVVRSAPMRSPRRPIAAIFRPMIRWLDAVLRAREGIFEYSDDPRCLFRIGLRRADRQIDLQDGAIIEAGDRFIELHFWNEHFTDMPHRPGADIAWGKAVQRGVARSLKLLASYLESREDLRDIPAIYGRTAMIARSPKQIRQIIRHFGFELDLQPRQRGFFQRLHDRGEDMLIRFLSWAFNPFGRKMGTGALPRHEIWMSRRLLLERYGSTTALELAESAATPSRRSAKRPRPFGRDAAERRARRRGALTSAQSEDGVGR